MGRNKAVTQKQLKKLKADVIEIADVKAKLKELRLKETELSDEIKPVLTKIGGVFETDGIVAQIVPGETWEVDIRQFIEKYKEQAYDCLNLILGKFRDTLGTDKDLAEIGCKVPTTPQLRVTAKENKEAEQ